jgi:hypothetical protein
MALCLTNHLSFEAQRLAATALTVLSQRIPEAGAVLAELMGAKLHAAFVEAPHQFHHALNEVRAHEFRVALLPFFSEEVCVFVRQHDLDFWLSFLEFFLHCPSYIFTQNMTFA